MDIETAGKEICEILVKNKHIAFFAGGCVRDSLHGTTPKDIDIATSATPDEVENLFANSKPVGKSFGVVLVKHKGHEFEVATFRTDIGSDTRRPKKVEFASAEKDSHRRDLTINSLFYDPLQDKYIDFTSGMKDLKNRTIRFTGDPELRIKEDYLRILRAIRFKLLLGFEFEEDTLEAVKNNVHLIQYIAVERVQQELLKMIEIYKPRETIELLLSTGAIDYIIPEMTQLKGCPQNPDYHSEGDVLEHTILVAEHCSKYKDPVLMLAALLHDIGKPYVTKEESGKATSKQHEKIGAEITEEILKRLKFSNSITKEIVSLVRDHMKLHNVCNMKKSTIKRLLSQDNIDRLLKLGECDEEGRTAKEKRKAGWMLLLEAKENFALEKEETGPEPLISGKDLIAQGMTPGPAFKTMLEDAYELQLMYPDLPKQEILRKATYEEQKRKNHSKA